MSNQSNIPTPATPDVCTVAVLVEGREIPGELHVLGVSVEHEVNRVPAARLQFHDGEAAKSTFAVSNRDLFIPGKKIEIKLGYRSKNDRVFTGIVVRHSIRIRKSGTVLIVDCRDEAVRMTAGLKCRYFVEKKDSEIMEDVIGANNLKKDVEATTLNLKQVVQYDASDWDFLLCRAEANGHVVVVEDATVRSAKPALTGNPVVSVAYGSTILELDAEIDARVQSTGVRATSWNAADQALIDVDGKEPSAPANGNLAASTLAAVLGGGPLRVIHGGKITQPELQVWADARLTKERLAKVRGRAKFQGFAQAKPDTVVQIDGIGDRFTGKMYISGVRHTVAAGNWETDVQIGLSPEPVAATLGMRPLPSTGLIPGVGGLQIGVVTVLENDPDGEDRIKVRLPLVSKSDEGIWSRVATLDAGNQRGTYFRPEIGDEVIVGFLGDDPRHPVVLGMCHSSAKPAPEAAKDTNHHKGYVSREKMKFTFDDEKKIVVLETPAGNKLTLSEEDKGIVLVDQNGNKMTFDTDGIKIESCKDLSCKATTNVKIEGVNVESAATAMFKATGTGSAVISGGVVQIN